MKRATALLTVLLISIATASQLSAADGDGVQGALADSYHPQATETHLVEWFSQQECEQCREFEVASARLHTDVSISESTADAAWISWFAPNDAAADGLSRLDTGNRLDMLGVNQTPYLLVDGAEIELGPSVGDWSSALETALDDSANTPMVDLPLTVALVDSTGDRKADSITFQSEVRPIVSLHNETAIHIHIIEWSVDPDALGSADAIPHVLLEWVPRLDFSVEAGNSTSWEYTLSETYLESAGIDLSSGDSDRYGFVLSMHGDARSAADSMRVLHVISGPLPSLDQHSGWGGFPLVLLVNLLLVVGLTMIVLQERVRELGLPKIEGKDVSEDTDERRCELKITAGNRGVKISEISVSTGWRLSRSGRKPELAAGESGTMELRIRQKGEYGVSPLLITIKTDVEDLGHWLMDVDMS